MNYPLGTELDMGSPTPLCAPHCFYAKSAKGGTKLMVGTSSNSQLAPVSDPESFLIYSSLIASDFSS